MPPVLPAAAPIPVAIPHSATSATSTSTAEETSCGPAVRGRPCKGVLRPDIVFFGESLPRRYDESIIPDLAAADLFVAIGTSMRVRPAGAMLEGLRRDTPAILINAEPLRTVSKGVFDLTLMGQSDVVCAALASRLGQGFSSAVDLRLRLASEEAAQVASTPSRPRSAGDAAHEVSAWAALHEPAPQRLPALLRSLSAPSTTPTPARRRPRRACSVPRDGPASPSPTERLQEALRVARELVASSAIRVSETADATGAAVRSLEHGDLGSVAVVEARSPDE